MTTPHQRRALHLVATGHTVDETAHAMHLSRSAVEKLLARARGKLGARNVTHAVYLAAKHGIISALVAALFFAGMSPDASLWRRQHRSRRRDEYAMTQGRTGAIKGTQMLIPRHRQSVYTLGVPDHYDC